MDLKSIRIKKEYTQQYVADCIGCSVTVYSRYERGEREPSIEMLIKLADFFDVTVDYLIGREVPSVNSFSKYEMDLITAARGADERAREDALNTLQSHQVKKGETRRA